jgi:hypothetical protein
MLHLYGFGGFADERRIYQLCYLLLKIIGSYWKRDVLAGFRPGQSDGGLAGIGVVFDGHRDVM